MKTMKKLFALLLAVLVVMGMATTAMADDEITITVKNAPDGHTYAAYQIFKGKLHAGVLTDIDWGNAEFGSALLAELTTNSGNGYPLFEKDNVNLFASATDAASVAGVIVGWPYNETDIQKFADVVAGVITAKSTSAAASSTASGGKCVLDVTTAGTGYYLIMDTTDEPSVEGATDFLLQVVGPTEVATKSSKPTFAKSVHTSLEGTYTKVIDSEVSDVSLANLEKENGKLTTTSLNTLATSNAVWFKLEAKLPSLFNNYNHYYLKFTDEVPLGLKPVEGSSQNNIYLLHENGTKTILDSETSVTQKKNASDEVIGYTISLDLGDFKEQLKTKNVTFNLNDTIVLKYATRVVPNAVLGKGSNNGNMNTATMIFSSDMNETATTNYKTATMKDSASVYTYQATFTKVDSVTKVPLAGAEFVLYRHRAEKVNSEDKLVPYYAIVDDGWITDWTTNIDSATRLVSSNVTKNGDDYTGGTFTVKGLDALSYHLKEMDPPDGYELMKETVLFTINKEFTGDTLSSISITIDGGTSAGEVNDGSVEGSINNTQGKILPTTGGIGTTIFYIVGGVLVLGAGAAFVMKRRNEA